ncbi:ATP-binding cassette domain-containing protein [Thalassobacillus sp. CUG 92003]|uniref:ATP-binding cassette domain-containing protein n=1 Tax=Thalassobacillus sp. CUG 92003 TaxID=2736641 RepID=UPI0015E7C03B|nr:ABC transporter ATP-binding protein [Thalassobacillus sp. CUG 92003]
MLLLNIEEKNHGQNFQLKDINVEINPGEITLLLGHNGAGKTTIIKSMFGLMDYAGSLSINGQAVDMNQSNHIDYLKQHVAYISDGIGLFEYLTPREYFSLIEKTFPAKVNLNLLEKFIEIFELEQYLDLPIDQLSHGNKKKTQIVSQLFRESDYVVFDEPTNGLDPDMVIVLKKTLSLLKERGKGIMLSTHHLNFGEDLYDHLIILRNGDKKLNDSKTNIYHRLGPMNVEQIYQSVNQDYYQHVEEVINELYN